MQADGAEAKAFVSICLQVRQNTTLTAYLKPTPARCTWELSCSDWLCCRVITVGFANSGGEGRQYGLLADAAEHLLEPGLHPGTRPGAVDTGPFTVT